MAITQKKLFNKKKLNFKNFKYFTSINQTLKDADFIQECATENYSLKTNLIRIIGKYAKVNAIISSSYQDYFQQEFFQNVKMQKGNNRTSI